MAKNCCICQKKIESEDAPILAMGAYGSPKCVCESCDGIIETATRSADADEATAAIRKLGEALTLGDTDDTQVIDTVNSIISEAAERAEAIKAGVYDFANDAESEPEFELDEDMLESEEDRALDEKEAKANKIIDTITGWLCGGMLVAAVVFFIIKFVL